MRGALVIALCATGCFSDRGVAIEVDVGDTGATSVELFIGRQPCNSNTGQCVIEPPGATCALSDPTWFRDDVHRVMTMVQGHTATFRLTSDTTRELPIVIAVGSTTSGELVGTATLTPLPVPANTAQIVTTTLTPAKPVMPTPPDPKNTEDRVQVWSNKQTPAGVCVQVEHWRPNAAVQRDAVVPANDPECNEGVSPGSLPTVPDCITPSSGFDACTLGVRLCDDASGAGCAALPKRLCVPDQLCKCTSDTCILGALSATSIPPVPTIDCTIPVDTIGTVCGPQSAEVDLGSRFHTSCEQPLLAMSTIPIGGFAPSAMINGVTITLGPNSERCKFTVTASGGVSGPLDGNNLGVVKLTTESSALLLPLHLRYATGCSGQGMFCTPPQDDNNRVWTCAQ